MDDLDEENKDFDKLQYLGPAGDYMAYIRCGVSQCDVYYTEILLGQLYVGSLYTLNEGGEEADFCPVQILGSSLQNLLYYRSKCEGSDTVNIFYSVMGYRKSDL